MTTLTATITEQIKDTLDILDVARALGLEIRRKQARCFNSSQHKHNDEHFSLGFYESNTKFKCFTCGVNGSVIDLYMGVKGVDIKEAIRELSEMAGIDTPKKPVRKADIEQPHKTEKVLTRGIYEALANYCNGVDDTTLAYLKGDKRGLTEDTIKRFKLFSVKDYAKTAEYLKANYTPEELKEIGVFNEKGNLTYYQHRLVVPFYQGEKIVFIQARRTDEGHPKYINASLTVPLFNADILKRIETGSTVYICEGVFDAMVLEQNGFNAVAILGVESFKPEWTGFFTGLDVVLCLDNDEAGTEATRKLAEMFYLKGIQVHKKTLPQGVKDVTDYFIGKGVK